MRTIVFSKVAVLVYKPTKGELDIGLKVPRFRWMAAVIWPAHPYLSYELGREGLSGAASGRHNDRRLDAYRASEVSKETTAMLERRAYFCDISTLERLDFEVTSVYGVWK